MSDSDDETTAERDARAEHTADDPPTPDQEQLADQLAADVSPDVARHAEEINEIGANVRGEGEIAP